MNTRDASDVLNDTGIPGFLKHDLRPTLVYDTLDGESMPAAPRQPIHRNPAFQKFWDSSSSTKNHDESEKSLGTLASLSASSTQEIRFKGHRWSSFIFQERWKIISCNENENVTRTTPLSTSQVLPGSSRSETYGSTSSATVSSLSSSPMSRRTGAQDNYKNLDWTQQEVDGMSHYIRFLRNFDWASSSLGSTKKWSSDLRKHVVSLMLNPDPRILIWGPDHIIVYNEASVPLIGSKHPHALGRQMSYAFSEIYANISPIICSAMEDGQVIHMKKFPLILDRSGFAEETFFSFTIIPIIDASGKALGAIDEFVELTSAVVGERRMATVIKMGEISTTADDAEAVWTRAVKVLDENTNDVPFALLYVMDDDGDEKHHLSSSASIMSSSHSVTTSNGKVCSLKGLVGIERDNEHAFKRLDLSDVTQVYSAPFGEVLKTGKPVILKRSDGSLPLSLSKGIQGRVSSVPCTEAIVCAIRSLSSQRIIGFFIIGLNPQRPYDDDYQLFFNLLMDQLSNLLAVVTLSLEQRKARTAANEAASLNATLARQLLLRTEEAEKSEAKFMRMAHHAPLGMYMLKPDGTPIYMNDAYYKLTGIQRDAQMTFDSNVWREPVLSTDVPTLENFWKLMIAETRPVTFEYRLKRPWKSLETSNNIELTGSTWLHATAFPELNDDGSVRAIMGWVTDISLEKNMADLQSRRLNEALEKKRQHENFIDMTSHEMRNPLSAIIQSADGILTLHKDIKPNSRGICAIPVDMVRATLDAAQTIVLCAQHQKHIVDDVLTLSKVESNLMTINPDKTQPTLLVKQLLKMYEAEFQSADIDVSVEIDSSYKEKGIDKVIVDPSRLLQILINLLTNAIKFTKNRKKRSIKILLGASYESPSARSAEIAYVSPREGRFVPKIAPEWGNGREVYLKFAVQDTGKGLNEEEMQFVFNRFSQASQQTFSEYGGSGLGLFISKELSELLGGQIGVRSNKGDGCTFVFYVKVQQVDPTIEETPVEETPQDFESPLHPPGLGHRIRPEPKRSVSEYPFTKRPSTSRKSSSKTLPSSPVSPQGPLPILPDENLHVLVAEDNAINQRVTAQQLRIAGCTVHVADNGVETLDFLRKSEFAALLAAKFNLSSQSKQKAVEQPVPLSVILLDLEMPVMDGLTCIRHIREMEAAGELNRHVPVIAVTARARNEQIATALAAGMDLVITKPFRIPDLLPQMEALVRG